MATKKVPKKKITLMSRKQSLQLEAQFTTVKAELLKLQSMLEEAGSVPVGGWRPGRPGGIDECDVVCDAECGIVCYQGECCSDDCEDSSCSDESCLDETCADEERFLSRDFTRQILLPKVRIESVMYTPKNTKKIGK